MPRWARAIVGAYLFAWVGVSVPLGQMYVLENSWYCELMAHDPSYIYESYRTLAAMAPWIWCANFVCGAVAGWNYK
jgi:hypothetical protein